MVTRIETRHKDDDDEGAAEEEDGSTHVERPTTESSTEKATQQLRSTCTWVTDADITQ